jgi:hypothetical protein
MSAVAGRHRAETPESRDWERESVERVQFPIGPRGRKKKGRWRGEARLKETPRRAVVRHDEAEGKKNQKRTRFSLLPFSGFVICVFTVLKFWLLVLNEIIPESQFPIPFFHFSFFIFLLKKFKKS